MKCPCHTQLSDMMVEALPCAPSETPPGAALAGTRHLLDFFVAALWPGASESSLQRNSQLTKHLHSGVCCMPSQLGRDASCKTVTFMQVQNVQPSKAEMLERHLARVVFRPCAARCPRKNMKYAGSKGFRAWATAKSCKSAITQASGTQQPIIEMLKSPWIISLKALHCP